MTHQWLLSGGHSRAENIVGSAVLQKGCHCGLPLYLISGGVVDLRSDGLSLGLRGEQRLGFVEAEAEDLAVQLVILLPQLLVLLKWSARVGRMG